MLEVLLAQQWQIEVHAWVDSLGDVFSELLKKYPDGVQVKPLDEALQSLVFLKEQNHPALENRDRFLATILEAMEIVWRQFQQTKLLMSSCRASSSKSRNLRELSPIFVV